MADSRTRRRGTTPRTAAAAAVIGAVVLAVAVTIGLVTRDDAPDGVASTPSVTPPVVPSAPPGGAGSQDAAAAPDDPDASPAAEDPDAGSAGSSGSASGGAESPDGAAGEAPPLFGDQETEHRDVDETADFGSGVEARIVGLERIEASGTGVGQVAGEAALVTVELVNRRGEAVSLATATVTAYGTDGVVPAGSVDDERAQRLPAELPANGTAQGRYAFSLPPGESDSISVAVMLDLGSPVMIFEAPVPPGD